MISFDCKVINATTKEDSSKKCSQFDFSFKCVCDYGDNEQLIFIYTYAITWDDKEILFRQESVYISSLYSGADCFYRFVISPDYKSLDLR